MTIFGGLPHCVELFIFEIESLHLLESIENCEITFMGKEQSCERKQVKIKNVIKMDFYSNVKPTD